MTAACAAKHAAVFVVAILAGLGVYYSYACICMFSNENELACTDASQQFVVTITFLVVAVVIYGLWGLMRFSQSNQ